MPQQFRRRIFFFISRCLSIPVFRVTQLHIYIHTTTKILLKDNQHWTLPPIPTTRFRNGDVCDGFPLIGLYLRASFLTNGVLFYNNNFIIYFVWQNHFFIFEKKKIVQGFYRVVKTVVLFKVLLILPPCIIGTCTYFKLILNQIK